MQTKIMEYLKDCYLNYIPGIRKRVTSFPEKYVYPYGNPVQPVLPVQLTQNKIMLIGAFPSARFERKNGFLIPVADNLSPFAEEKYFDGQEIRIQPSRESLNLNYFPQLQVTIDDLWLTDLVKIYLFPEKHIKNCKEVSPQINFVNTHDMFKAIAEASLDWIKKEIELCDPVLIITLGEIVARVISSDFKTENKNLLNGDINQIKLDKVYKIAHLAHPEIRRLNQEWDERTEAALARLAGPLQKFLQKAE